jgi:LuxR family maltose regulon positive regulatory protein
MQNLSDLEAKILRLLADGLSNQQIADRLSLTVRNVKYQAKKIYTKIGVGSRAALGRISGLNQN